MEVCYLALTGQVKNVLLVSNSHDNAVDLLLPFKAFFESSQRVEQDYGKQPVPGRWTADKFTTRCGCSFRAIGWGESPRGTRNKEKRPDFILLDDFDTDEECRNEDTMRNKVAWVEQALIPTRSISSPTRILVNGNIIHENCAVKYMGENLADKFDMVNIRGADGKSSGPEKNTEEQIDRVLATISHESAQKEYSNNPMAGSGKAVGVIAAADGCFYVAKVFLSTMATARFVDALFGAYDYAVRHKADAVQVFIENNSLQNPFYEQVLLPAIHAECGRRGVLLPVIPDTRDKKDKYTRIAGLLEPRNRAGRRVFIKADGKPLTEADMVEGGVFKLQERLAAAVCDGFYTIKRKNKFKI